jgi:hypothetical protein
MSKLPLAILVELNELIISDRISLSLSPPLAALKTNEFLSYQLKEITSLTKDSN